MQTMTNKILVSDTIPMTPQPWCKAPSWYVHHQKLLRTFARHLEDKGVDIELPKERSGYDLGVDIMVGWNRANFDLKSFGLRQGPHSLTWDSSYWAGRAKPIYDTTLTDFFLHPIDGPVGNWHVCMASGLHTSMFAKEPPFYYPQFVQTVDSFLSRYPAK